ncbi:transposase [Leisingera sp. M527]|uniref:transposase n=1 Tax=Leisingera sp. M527 TaxID=2867014 RepID=UPI0038FC6F7C
MKHGDRKKVMQLETGEFIRRFLTRVLSDGFHRIRHYGLLASAACKANIARIRDLLGRTPIDQAPRKPVETVPLSHRADPFVPMTKSAYQARVKAYADGAPTTLRLFAPPLEIILAAQVNDWPSQLQWASASYPHSAGIRASAVSVLAARPGYLAKVRGGETCAQ